MIKYAALALGILALSGCAEWTATKSGVATYGARIADENLDVAVWDICKAATAGSLERRFWNKDGGFDAWWEFCHETAKKPAPPPVE